MGSTQSIVLKGISGSKLGTLRGLFDSIARMRNLGADVIQNRFAKLRNVSLSMALVGMFALSALGDEVPRILPDELKSMLGKSDVVVVDVRSAETWRASDRKVKGAVREDSEDVESWADNYPKYLTLVLY